MNDIEKKALLDSTIETLLSLKSKEITVLGDAVYVGSCTTIASLAISGIIQTINPEANLVAPLLVGGLGLVLAIFSYFKKKNIIKNAEEAAMKIVEYAELGEDSGDNMKLQESQLPDYDNLTLEDKCNLLIGYAWEVSYPGFEDDAHVLYDIIEGIGCYEDDDMQSYGEALKIIEHTMLEKAYQFYNGNYSR